MNSAQPVAEGNLSHTPFLHLVLYLHQRRSSGTLVLQHHGRETKVLFRDGRAVAAKPVPRGSTLQPGLLPLCSLLEGPYTFWSEDLIDGTSGVVKGTVDPYTLVVDSLRQHVREDIANEIVDRYMQVPLSLQSAVDPRRLGLRGQDATLLDLLQRGPFTAQALLEQSITPRDHCRRLIYALLITKCLAPVEAATSASGVRQAVTVSPPWAELADGQQQSAQAMSRRSSRAPAGRSAPPSAHRASAAPSDASGAVPAWKSLATLRPPGRASSSFPPASGAPPRSLTPVHGTPRAPVVPSSSPPPVEALDDPGKFRRVKQLADNRNFGEAGRLLEQLIERHSHNADYLAMRAWLIYSESTGPKVPPMLIAAINEALRVDADHPQALYTKAMTLKRMGRQAEAMRFFQRVAERDPSHLEARRELRLMQMRKKR